jgi:hypothetical protein
MDLDALKRAVIMLKFSSPSYRSTYSVHMCWERISPSTFYGNFKTWKCIMIFIFHQFPNLKKNRSSITLVLHLYEVGRREQKWVSTFYRAIKVRDDPKQMGDSGEVPIPEWIGLST